MKAIYIFIILGILTIGLSLSHFLDTNDVPVGDAFLTIEAINGFEIIFDPLASKELREYHQSGTVVINGSYFMTTSSGGYLPAGLWNIKWQKYYQDTLDRGDPNLSHIVLYDHAGGMVLFFENGVELPPCAKRNTKSPDPSSSLECSTFQAGPLLYSSDGYADLSRSWHASEEHERTIMGVTEEWKIYFFIFPLKITLKNATEQIQKKFSTEAITLLNLDGGPSTSYFDGKEGYWQFKKIPIILRINIK